MNLGIFTLLNLWPRYRHGVLKRPGHSDLSWCLLSHVRSGLTYTTLVLRSANSTFQFPRLSRIYLSFSGSGQKSSNVGKAPDQVEVGTGRCVSRSVFDMKWRKSFIGTEFLSFYSNILSQSSWLSCFLQ